MTKQVSHGNCIQWTYDKWIKTGKSKTVVCGLYRKVIQGGKSLNNLTHWWLEDDKYVFSQILNTKSMQYEDAKIIKSVFYKLIQSRKIKLTTVEMDDWCDIMSKINCMKQIAYNHALGWTILEDIKVCNRSSMKPHERQAYYLRNLLECP
jgi:hypothetical protein